MGGNSEAGETRVWRRGEGWLSKPSEGPLVSPPSPPQAVAAADAEDHFAKPTAGRRREGSILRQLSRQGSKAGSSSSSRDEPGMSILIPPSPTKSELEHAEAHAQWVQAGGLWVVLRGVDGASARRVGHVEAGRVVSWEGVGSMAGRQVATRLAALLPVVTAGRGQWPSSLAA